MFVLPGILAVGVFGELEEFLLRVAIARVALSNVAEFDVDEGFVGAPGDFAEREGGIGGRGGRDVDGGFFRGVEATDDALAVLASPPAVATEAARGGAAPVQTVCLVFPGRVAILDVFHLFEPVPRAWVQNVLEAADLGLGEDGRELMNDAEGIGSLEEAESR